jgi:polar amino acid transport system permease protein
MYEWDFSILFNYRWLLLQGMAITLAFTAAIIIGGMAIGLIAAMLIWFYYAFPILIGIEMTPTTASLLALSCYGGSFYAEIIRGGIVSIDRGQSEAGAALGMTPALAMRRIILPQALRRMVPPLMNQSILQFKNTSLVSVLAVPDLVYQGQMIAHDSFRPLETYTAIAVAYFAILFPLTVFVRSGERKLRAAND